MKFEEVLPLLKDGRKIRRKERPIVTSLELNNKLFSVTVGDLLADDWELVEAHKVKLRDLTIQQYDKWIKNNCEKYSYYCHGCPFQKVRCDNDKNKKDWRIGNKDLYSDKFLDQEIEVEDD